MSLQTNKWSTWVYDGSWFGIAKGERLSSWVVIDGVVGHRR